MISYTVAIYNATNLGTVVIPGKNDQTKALRMFYNTRLYTGPTSQLMDLSYSFSFMIEGPKPNPVQMFSIELKLCEIWAYHTSE